MKKIFILLVSALITKASLAQVVSVEQYIDTYKDFAIREMKRMGIPAAITLAQGILETENGNSDLVKKSNNHFGIKCKSTWTAEGVSHDDDAAGECFRSYKDAESSFRDHSNFLRGSDRYSFLFKLDPKDYRGWAYGLKKAGYATNPKYPQILIKFIEDNNLQQYTLLAVNDVPTWDGSKYKSDPEDKTVDALTKELSATQAEQINSNGSALQFENKININGITAIPAKKGTSLLAIATDNNVKLAKLLEFNDLEKDGLLENDQLIFLEKKSTEGEKAFYITEQNESLYDIAQKNGIRLENLCRYNNLKQDQPISLGTKLYLKPVSDAPENFSEKNTSDAVKVYTVQAREGLYTISKKYGISVSQLKEWNNLPNDNLKVGQELIISK